MEQPFTTPETTSLLEPPPPPNPSADEGVIPPISTPDEDAPSPPTEEEWNISAILPETAMKMLCRSVQTLVDVTGDTLPTSPISSNTLPTEFDTAKENRSRSSSRPATPVPSDDLKGPAFRGIEIGSPEACVREPWAGDVKASTAPARVQQEAIARKFFCKKPPTISLEAYLKRLQRWCPMSTAVFLAAGVYIYKLAVEEKLVPVTARTAHRLVLASLRVAMKALEDLRYPQARFAGVGGVGENELKTLEISVCYLTNFDLQVNATVLYQKTLSLQQAAKQVSAFRGKLPTFQPRLERLPLRERTSV